jgi:GH24 family phage-related lysozyme (muramidase)
LETVKARQDLVLHGGGAYASLTQARLTNAAVDDLTRSKAGEMEAHLVQRFANWDDLPADAQLGTLSLAWACGPAFNFPTFAAALTRGDFATCAVECQMNAVGNPGLIPRNSANKALFLAAAQGGDPEVVNWP